MHGLMRRLRVADSAVLALLYWNPWTKSFFVAAPCCAMNYSDNIMLGFGNVISKFLVNKIVRSQVQLKNEDRE